MENCEKCIWYYKFDKKCYHPNRKRIRKNPCWRGYEDKTLTYFNAENCLFEGYDPQGYKVFKEYLRRKGRIWVISALIDGSIGYYTYLSANNFINTLIQKRFWCAERTGACFKGDCLRKILRDLAYFEGINPQKRKRIIEFVRKTAKLNEMQQMTISMMYPTIAF